MFNLGAFGLGEATKATDSGGRRISLQHGRHRTVSAERAEDEVVNFRMSEEILFPLRKGETGTESQRARVALEYVGLKDQPSGLGQVARGWREKEL